MHDGLKRMTVTANKTANSSKESNEGQEIYKEQPSFFTLAESMGYRNDLD